MCSHHNRGRGAASARTIGQQGERSSWIYESISCADTRNKDTRTVAPQPSEERRNCSEDGVGQVAPNKTGPFFFFKEINIYLAVKGLSCSRIFNLH